MTPGDILALLLAFAIGGKIGIWFERNKQKKNEISI
jgi:hypothetical protein